MNSLLLKLTFNLNKLTNFRNNAQNCKFLSQYKIIDLRSDTFTKPSLDMRDVISNAEVGNDGYGEDPTVKELENLSSNLLGKESSLFVPSGTMANLIAIMSHCWQRSSEVILGDQSHIHLAEQGGISAIASVHSTTVRNNSSGTFNLDEMRSKIRPLNDSHFSQTTLICLENTHNVCNGSAVSTQFIDDVCKIAKDKNIAVHMDGARLFNASVKLGESPTSLVKNCDTVSFCLSKGLGCPVGSILSGSKNLIEKAEKCRKILGGGMRQTGILAAAGIYALNKNIDRLEDDHENAGMIANAIFAHKKLFITVDPKKVQTNIGYIEVDTNWMTAKQFANRLLHVSDEEKVYFNDDCCIVKMDVRSQSKLRYLTHLDVSREDTLKAISKINYVIDAKQDLCKVFDSKISVN